MSLSFGNLVVYVIVCNIITKPKQFTYIRTFKSALIETALYAYATPTFIIKVIHFVTHVQPLKPPSQ